MSEDRRHYDRSQSGGRDPHRDRDYRDKRKEGERRDQNHHRYREDREPKHGRRSRESDYPHRERDTSPYRNSPERPEAYTPASVPPVETGHYRPQSKEALYNLRYILTARGLCQIVDFFINMMIVVCAGVSHNASGGYRNLASLGGIYSYYFGGANAFTGAEADRVQELDRLFYELKLPPYIFSMACGGALMGYCLAFLLIGVFRVPYRWPVVLLAEAVLSGLISLGYIPALAFYFIKIQETYDSAICKEREQLYKSKGHQGFECKLHGADIAGGLFGVLGVIGFAFGAVLAIRAFRAVREMKKRRRPPNL